MASIKYKGKVVQKITAGQSVILHTEGHSLDGDIEIDGFDGAGSCDREHILEVAGLPSIGIDTTVLYKCKGRYYRYDGGDWQEYVVPSGTVTIVNNGTYNVGGIKKVEVDVQGKTPDLEPITITDNGTYTPSGDGFSEVTVAVDIPTIPEAKYQDITVTENGTYMADEGYDALSSVTVNVPISEVPKISTEAEMTALLETAEVGSVYKYVGESTDAYENGGLYIVEAVVE